MVIYAPWTQTRVYEFLRMRQESVGVVLSG